MKSGSRSRKYLPEKTLAIRPAGDSRPGPEKVAQTAKARASRARDEIVAFKRGT